MKRRILNLLIVCLLLVGVLPLCTSAVTKNDIIPGELRGIDDINYYFLNLREQSDVYLNIDGQRVALTLSKSGETIGVATQSEGFEKTLAAGNYQIAVHTDGTSSVSTVLPYTIYVTTDTHIHDFKFQEIVGSTCSKKGYSLYMCDCGTTDKRDYIDLIPHTEEVVEGESATCSKTGLTEGKKCAVCNATILEQEVIPTNDVHVTEVPIEAKEPTCMDPGSSEGKKCADCGATTQEPEPIPSRGHSYEYYTCIRCGHIDGIAVGSMNDDIRWHLSNAGTLSIDGTGYMWHSGSDVPWKEYREQIKKVEIQNGIVSIVNYAFVDCVNLEEIDIPDSVTLIESTVFSGCCKLKTVNLPKGLTDIAWQAFQNCGGLEEIEIPNSVTTINYSTFKDCINLKKVVLPKGLKQIDKEAFDGCPLEEIWIPVGIESIHECAFECEDFWADHDHIDHINTLYYGGTEEQWNALEFESKKLFDDATIHFNAYGVTCDEHTWDEGTVTKEATEEAEGEKTFTCTVCGETKTEAIPKVEHVHKWDDGEVTKEATEEAEGEKTFTCTVCGETKTEAIPKVEHVHKWDDGKETKAPTEETEGEKTFTCTVCGETKTEAIPKLEHVHSFGEAWLSDEAGHWQQCECGVKDGEAAHADADRNGSCDTCGYKMEVTSGDSIASGTCGSNLTWNLAESGVLTISGTGNMQAYIAPWSEYADQITEVVLEDGISNVGAEAFKNCRNLAEATLPDSVTSIAHGAFSGCGKLETVNLPKNLTKIVGEAFAGCSALKEVTVPAAVTDIGYSAFRNCTALQKITFQGSAPKIGNGAFHGVTAQVAFPEEDTTWNDTTKQSYGGTLTWGDEHEHSYTETVTPPTCEEEGFTTYTCSCGDTKVDNKVPALDHKFEEGICTVCNEKDPDYVKPTEPIEPEPTEPEVTEPEESGTIIRIAGTNRIKTAIASADKLKEVLGVDKFRTIVVANAMDFPDALSGSYLAAVAKAPILLYADGQTLVTDYIKNNLAPGGIVYILGGEKSVSNEIINKLSGIPCARVAGSGRFATSLAIIQRADELRGTKPDKVLICHALAFADSLSASATGLPILLVNGGGSLNNEQKAYLESVRGAELYVIGGKNSVSEDILTALNAYDADGAERIYGSGRELTSAAVARTFFPDAKSAALASSLSFPDGLSGGPVAYAMKMPLLLTRESKESIASSYIAERSILEGYVIGGTDAVADATANTVFGIE